MGLSEREQQLLDEMERRLYQSGADVMQTPSGVRRKVDLRMLVLGIVIGVVGVGALIAGVATQQLWIGLIGFVAMLGGVLLASKQSTVDTTENGAPTSARARSGQASETLGERMSRRWDERMEGER